MQPATSWATRLLLILVVVVSFLAGTSAFAVIGKASDSAAGTNIGNAKELTGSASGSLTSSISDDWYVVYPPSLGGTVQVKVEDTTTDGCQSCQNLDFTFSDTNGTSVGSAGLVPNTSYDTPVSSPDSDRYFVEITTPGCTPPSGHPVTYKLTLESGGVGTAPSPKSGSAAAGTSIGDAWPPLQGDTSYKGTITNGIADDWYVLYKHADAQSASIRVENTTVKASTDCTNLYVALHDTDGTSVGSVGLSDNTAHTFTVANGGRYYLEINDNGCVDGGTTYRIEPEPKGEWDNPAKLPEASLPTGPSLSKAGGPLKGGVMYTDSIPTSGTQLWAKFDPNGKVPHVTASVQNTTNNQSNCQQVYASLDNARGTSVGSVGLSANTGHEFTVDTKGPFYL